MSRQIGREGLFNEIKSFGLDARKPEIRRAVEKMFNVEVASVSVLNVKGKRKGMRGRNPGRRPGWRKAYVRLKPGHDIDFIGPVE